MWQIESENGEAMREIKFRAWDRKNKWMDDEIFVGPQGIYERASLTYDTPNLEIERSDKYELMQFTGLRDKNGREIYEGDVVKSHHDGNSYPIVFGSCELRDSRGEFEGFFDGLIWDGMPFGRDVCGGTDHYEVIGNIYENQELLK